MHINNLDTVCMAKICFITANYGSYEKTCKKFVKQTVETDFICFTDDTNIVSNGWIINTIPYHILCKSEIDDDSYTNSICNNSHTFNIAKYYKQSFTNIPILDKYDVVVWLDGTIEITYDRTSEYILHYIYREKIIGWHHEMRHGFLKGEVDGTVEDIHGRYATTFWNGQSQPYQDAHLQYLCYLNDGYTDKYFKDMNSHTEHFGVWITCFVAFLHKDKDVRNFLDLWYLQTLMYTTNDQIGFPYACQKTNMIPFTLPNKEITGELPHDITMFYIKHSHGR